MRPAADYKGREQTYVKHFFLERYLETVAFHIGYTHREFVYVDCFSGPWKSAEEQLADTSIRIALDKLNYVRNALVERGRPADIRAVFVEKDPTAFRALESALNLHRGGIRTTALYGTFEENIPAILHVVGATFGFFFIDPKGWTGFAMESITPILRHQPGEVMVNFMYDFVNRFISFPKPSNEQSLDRFFGTTTWRDVRDAPDRETASLDCYQAQLRAAGSYAYVTSTRILKPHSERAYFHLVYATRNPKGVIEFRDVEKRTVTEQEDIRARAQREQREGKTGQTEIAFGLNSELSNIIQEERARRLHEARSLLFAILQHGTIRYEQLQPRILEIPLVWNTDLKEILMTEYKAGRLRIDGFKAGQRALRPGIEIRLPQQ